MNDPPDARPATPRVFGVIALNTVALVVCMLVAAHPDMSPMGVWRQRLSALIYVVAITLGLALTGSSWRSALRRKPPVTWSRDDSPAAVWGVLLNWLLLPLTLVVVPPVLTVLSREAAIYGWLLLSWTIGCATMLADVPLGAAVTLTWVATPLIYLVRRWSLRHTRREF